MDAVLWTVAGVALLLVEIFTLAIFAGLVGVGALAAALAAVLGAPVVVQALAFVGTSAGLVVFARGPVLRALDKNSPDATTVDARALTGTPAVVVERVTETTGQVRLNGELWRARPYAGTGPVDVGRPVSVAAVEGATVLVYSSDLT